MSGGVLFLAHRIPFPPDRGDKIRSHNILKAIAAFAPVHVGCLAESGEDSAHTAALAQVAASYWMPQRSKPLVAAGMEAVLKRKPVSLTAFYNNSLAHWVRQTIAAHDIATIYVFSGQMGQYIPDDYTGRVVLDLVDVDSVKFEAYAEQSAWPKSWLHAREGRLLSAVETALAARADTTLLISEAEAALLRERTGHAGTIRALSNGIDCAAYAPQLALEKPSPYVGKGPHFAFTGQMDYPPNAEAVARFAKHILPRIQQGYPSAQFHIVGRAPVPAVVRLEELAGVTVHGSVPDMGPFLAHADQIAAPITIARGVQNKVLEAMAMGRPVLLSAQAATGIDAVAGEHFLICQSDEAFAKAALGLIASPQDAAALGKAARQFVCEKMSWPAMLSDLPAILGIAPQTSDHRDAA